MSEIELQHVYKIFGPHPERSVRMLEDGHTRDEVKAETGAVAAVIDASLTIERGEVFVVMGLSGSGKSTLVRTINRLFEPTSGRIVIDGTDVTGLGAKDLRQIRSGGISMVFQHFALMPHRTVLDNAAWGLEAAKVPVGERRERAQAALESVGLADRSDAYPGQLSGGMQQRVGLARALATDAEILLMDEAFSALDPLIRREMQDQMLDLQEGLGKTIVFITHDLNEAMRIGDRIAVMKDGRIVQVGTAEEILQDPANDYVASFIQDVDRSRVLTAASVMEQPVATLGPHEGPRAAMRIMRENQMSGLYVVGTRRRLRGAVSDEDATAAARRDGTIEEVLTTDVPTVAPDSPLVDLFAPAAGSPLPLAVVDDEGILLGIIPRVTLLAALAGDSNGASGADDDAAADGVPAMPTDQPGGEGSVPHG
ncbi:MAG: glycine betaine/L-proline ABC transporter ATP-binding protein [Acidimicrobiia bacterium]|nr:glycine betaine/L-proline ABC transporter ATP-binding protein [Acidimicrobiia bacterium]